MILTRTPLRISLGGGGTDLPSYYRRNGGSVLSAAIDKYVYLAVNETFSADYLLKYAELERVASVSDISHGLIREVLECYGVEPGVAHHRQPHGGPGRRPKAPPPFGKGSETSEPLNRLVRNSGLP